MEEIINMLHEVNTLSVVVRLIMAMILCGSIGIERGIKNRPAGFMTYLLVGCGSALIMITNQYIAEIYPGSDPTRMAAQVVSGIGFLGAGTIITTQRNEVRGLTTAAGLWAASAVGLASGIGFYSAAIIGTVLIIVSLIWLKRLDSYIKSNARIIEVYIEYSGEFAMKTLTDFIADNGYDFFDLEIGRSKKLEGEVGTVNFMLNLKGKVNHATVISEIENMPGVISVRGL